MKCKTGGLYENLEQFKGATCDGYYETMQVWLVRHGFVN